MEPVAHQLTDLGSVAGVATLAVLLGLCFVRLRQPPIVGYIIAGVILGPTGFGVIENSESIKLLAELGVLLLLFLIGMEISIKAFVLVLFPSLFIMGGQVAAGLGVSFLFGWFLGWNFSQMLLLGFIVAVSSTAVAIKILEDIGELRTETGRITIGVLVAQDIAIVPMLIVTESLGGNGEIGIPTIALVIASVALLGLLIWYLNKPGKIKLPFTEHFTGKSDMIALAMLAFCFSAATISSLVGLSPVYGAFVAGLIVANSTLRAEAITLTYPVQSILVFVFFLSVGLLLDLDYMAENWRLVIAFVLLTVVTKSFLNILLVKRAGLDWGVAFPAGLAMAQIGEFSFILASVGIASSVLNDETYRLAIAVIASTLIISPLWMVIARRFEHETKHRLHSFRSAIAVTSGIEPENFTKENIALLSIWHKLKIYYRAYRVALKHSIHSSKETSASDDESDKKPTDQ
jgi:CPA2 family monovalent cation:H+ antiporter-2